MDGVAQGLDVKDSVAAATTTALPAYLYNNGSMGAGATLTANPASGPLVVDGHTVALNDRILVMDETGGNAPYNGIYPCTTLGTSLVPWVLTRTTDMDASPEVPGAFCFVLAGATNGLSGFVVVSTGTYVIGTTPILWTQFSAGGSAGATSGGLPVYNVKTYGALGDGTTVDTTAVQSAVTAALAGGGGIVFFPPGTYPISGVTFGSSLIVQGAGQQGASGTGPTAGGGTVLLLDPAQKVVNGPNTVVCRVAPASSTNYTSFFAMRDLTIDGNKGLWADTTRPRSGSSGSTAVRGPA